MSGASPARRVAFEVVRRVFESEAYADRVLRSAAATLDSRDEALARRLAFGTVQRVRTLDAAIEAIGRRPVRRIDPPVLAALRLGAYQLMLLDGIARYAAVNESVELVRSAGAARAVSFANAVLRRLGEQGRAFVARLPETTPAEAAVRHSYPDWMVEGWWRQLGSSQTLALLEAQNEPSPIVVRVRSGSVDGTPDLHVPGAWHVGRVDEAAVQSGRIWPQSAASQVAGLCVPASQADRVLDLCAAPGGKTAQLAERAARVVAVELNKGRARELRANLARMLAGSTSVVDVLHADGRELPAELGEFDHALVDAPCSGLGVLASRPDLRWRARPLPHLQLELLRSAVARVRPGGTVTYSVCTTTDEETLEIVDASGLAPDDLGAEWPAFAYPGRSEFLRTLPHVHGTAGFFIARLRVPG